MSMKKDYLISVIVPIYNVENYLYRCVNSIVQQSYDNLEIVLVDDGSTDRCGEICDDYCEKDSRIKVVHKRNGGLVSARKAGAAAASGDYVINVDGDDWVEKDYFENFVRGILSHEPDIIYSTKHYKDYYNHSDIIKVNMLDQKEMYRIYSGEYGFLKCEESNVTYGLWLVCVKRKLYVQVQNSIDDNIVDCEDVSCIIRLMARTDKVLFIDEGGYHYVQRSDSITHNKRKFSDIVLHDTLNYLDQVGISRNCGFQNVIAGMYGIMKLSTEFGQFQKIEYDYLFPFSDVKKGSNVVVYGAGSLGKLIIEHILDTKQYSLVSWVDTNEKTEIHGIKIEPVNKLLTIKYDKIIIATVKRRLMNEMCSTLEALGIHKNEISLLDYGLLNALIEQ